VVFVLDATLVPLSNLFSSFAVVSDTSHAQLYLLVKPVILSPNGLSLVESITFGINCTLV